MWLAVKVVYKGLYRWTLPYKFEKNEVNEKRSAMVVDVLNSLFGPEYKHEVIEVKNGPTS